MSVKVATIESKVFTKKLEALRHNREHAIQFFEATVPYKDEPKQLFIVAVSEHRAQLALVEHLMDLKKWPKKKQDEEYIAVLEAETNKSKLPLFDKDAP